MTKKKTIKIVVTKEMVDEFKRAYGDSILYGYKHPELGQYLSGHKLESDFETDKRLAKQWRKDDEIYCGLVRK